MGKTVVKEWCTQIKPFKYYFNFVQCLNKNLVQTFIWCDNKFFMHFKSNSRFFFIVLFFVFWSFRICFQTFLLHEIKVWWILGKITNDHYRQKDFYFNILRIRKNKNFLFNIRKFLETCGQKRIILIIQLLQENQIVYSI